MSLPELAKLGELVVTPLIRASELVLKLLHVLK